VVASSWAHIACIVVVVVAAAAVDVVAMVMLASTAVSKHLAYTRVDIAIPLLALGYYLAIESHHIVIPDSHNQDNQAGNSVSSKVCQCHFWQEWSVASTCRREGAPWTIVPVKVALALPGMVVHTGSADGHCRPFIEYWDL
jgi:hypothetical protein